MVCVASTIDDAPAVLAAANLLAVHHNILLGADDGEGQDALPVISSLSLKRKSFFNGYLDRCVKSNLFLVVLLIIVGVHAEVVEGKLLLYPFLEGGALLQGQAVALGNDRHDVDELAQFLENDNVDGLEAVARGLDEEEAAVDARVLEVTLALGGELLAQVSAVLVLDVLDNGVPAALVVDQVAVAGRVDDVEPQTHAVLLDGMRDSLDLRRLADGLVRQHAALAVHQV